MYLYFYVFILSRFLSSNQATITKYRKTFEDPSLPLPVSVHKMIQHKKQMIHGRKEKTELTPLYPGYGTHFSYVYVGTPPQRQSVIVDTGSKYTGFPCVNCTKCGTHTDSYWNITNSSTAHTKYCNNSPCKVSQSYSEGSTWNGFQVQDVFWVGGVTDNLVPDAEYFKVKFEFVCQTSETGLFITQLADGIMGMAMSDKALPDVLKKENVTDTRIFALCYRMGGGIMTLGGVDQQIHLPDEPIEYAKLVKMNDWYGLVLTGISLQNRRSGALTKLEGATTTTTKSTGIRGCIIDSGTTDTYFPSFLEKTFADVFKKISGFAYSSDTSGFAIKSTANIPDIVFSFQRYGGSNESIQIIMPWQNYIESVGDGKYAFRIYLSEKNTFILGSNFMIGYNIIFDQDGGRIGFAKSNCEFEKFVKPATLNPTESSYFRDDDYDASKCRDYPTSKCSASCSDVPEDVGQIVEGIQIWKNPCGDSDISDTGPKPCHVICHGPHIVRGDKDCPDTPWSECDKGCSQTRKIKRPKRRLPNQSNGHVRHLSNQRSEESGAIHRNIGGKANIPLKCDYISMSRNCSTGACPVTVGDYLAFIDMKVRIDPKDWSYVYKEAFYTAIANIFDISESSVDLLNDANSELSNRVKLRFEMRIKGNKFKSLEDLTDFAENIPEFVQTPQFKTRLINELEVVTKQVDEIDHNRFGWMRRNDIEVSNAFVLPKASIREHLDIFPIKEHEPQTAIKDLLFIAISIAAIITLGTISYMYHRLRIEHEALSKDKVMGGSLRRMWDRFIKMEYDNPRPNHNYKKLRMEEFSSALDDGRLTAEEDTQLDMEDDVGNRS